MKIKEPFFSQKKSEEKASPQQTIMKKNVSTRVRTGQGLGCLALSSYLALSSNVAAQQNITVFDDPLFGDPDAPVAPAFGFDITRTEFRYSPETDVLDIRIKFAGIAGDADGDGDPNSGIGDINNFEFGEIVNLAFNFNNDAFFDYNISISESFPSDASNIPLQSLDGVRGLLGPTSTQSS